MEKSQTRLPFLDIIRNESGAKIWMDICNKPTDSKRCLKNISFSHARRICTIVEIKDVKENALRNWKNHC